MTKICCCPVQPVKECPFHGKQVTAPTEPSVPAGSSCAPVTGPALPEVVGDICKIVSIARDMVEYSRTNGVAIPGEWDDVLEASERLLLWAEATQNAKSSDESAAKNA